MGGGWGVGSDRLRTASVAVCAEKHIVPGFVCACTAQGHKRLVLTGVVSLFNDLDRTITERDSSRDGCEGWQWSRDVEGGRA